MDDWANLAVEGHFMPKSRGGITTNVLQSRWVKLGALASSDDDEYPNGKPSFLMVSFYGANKIKI
jgi:hypothetical protein